LTVKLRVADQGPWTKLLLTAWTRQKYVPFARPLTVSCVAGAVTEFWRTMFAKLDVALTCQLYAVMPLGSEDCDHEMVNGSVTEAASAGESGVGAVGAATALPPVASASKAARAAASA
jgi:hypothetical protein